MKTFYLSLVITYEKNRADTQQRCVDSMHLATLSNGVYFDSILWALELGFSFRLGLVACKYAY